MSGTDALLTAIREMFAAVERPAHFCNHMHCCECAEHDETLLSHTPETISLAELGNPGWDPVCFINSPQGFQYYLPALVRLAAGRGREYYLDSFLFHLNGESIAGLTGPQRALLAEFLEALLARIAHRYSAAKADLPVSAAFSPAWVLGVVSTTPARPDRRKCSIYQHLHLLAWQIGERWGLDEMPAEIEHNFDADRHLATILALRGQFVPAAGQ